MKLKARALSGAFYLVTASLDVRFGSEADIDRTERDVCFVPEVGANAGHLWGVANPQAVGFAESKPRDK